MKLLPLSESEALDELDLALSLVFTISLSSLDLIIDFSLDFDLLTAFVCRFSGDAELRAAVLSLPELLFEADLDFLRGLLIGLFREGCDFE